MPPCFFVYFADGTSQALKTAAGENIYDADAAVRAAVAGYGEAWMHVSDGRVNRYRTVLPKAGSDPASSLSPKARASLTVPGTFATYADRAAFAADAAVRLLCSPVGDQVLHQALTPGGRTFDDAKAARLVVRLAEKIFDKAHALPGAADPQEPTA